MHKRPAQRAGLLVRTCAFVIGAYMLLDGIVATQTGHYTGTSLGPWAAIVQSVGLDPLSYTMHRIFIVYGILWLAAIAYASTGRTLSLLAMAILTLWYVPLGTFLSLCIIASFLWTRARKRSR